MIARHWRGLARAEFADAYVAHLRRDTFPQLEHIAGFIDASILKRTVERGVEFLVVTRWRSLEAIKAFAGSDAETAVVPPEVQRMMLEYDTRARHFELVD
jgi:heme-degrading monooxygenase HmoA